MALIDCPECGSQVSDRAPSCPHCGVPIAAAAAATAAPTAAEPQTATDASGAESATPQQAEITPQIQEVQPFAFRLAGRRLPVASLLFWGGMVFGIIQGYAFPVAEGESSPYRTAAFYMIFAGALWFAVTEFVALIRSRRQRRLG